MKCFACGSNCITVYINARGRMIISPAFNDTIIAVGKDCLACEWSSYPTKLPSKLPR